MARHRMTPARRAALRKAQLASVRARKLRRRQKRIKIGLAVGGAALAVGGTGVVLGRKIRTGGPRDVVNFEPPQAITARRPRGNQNPIPKRPGVFKVGGSHLRNQPRYVKRNRPGYDARRRAAYVPQKTRRKTKNERLFG